MTIHLSVLFILLNDVISIDIYGIKYGYLIKNIGHIDLIIGVYNRIKLPHLRLPAYAEDTHAIYKLMS